MNKLAEGVVGRKLVAYFAANEGRVAVDAKSLGSQGQDQNDYEITFESGSVQAYRITFAAGMRFDVLDATPMN